MDPFSSLISGMFSAYNTYETNQLNRGMFDDGNVFNKNEAIDQRLWSSEEARINRAFQESQIQKQQDYQERLSNSAWQRSVDDMQAAGLNPMLAYRQGGASQPTGGAAQGSMPSGTSASSVAPPRMQGLLTGALDTALSAANIEKVQADVERTRAETENIKAENPYKRGLAGRQDAEVDRIRKDAERIVAQTSLTDDQRKKVHEEIENAIREGRRIDVDIEHRKIQNELHSLDIPGRLNQAAFQTKYRDYNIDLQPFIGDAAKGIGSAVDLLRILKPNKMFNFSLPKR